MRRRRVLAVLAATAALAGCGRCGRTPPPVRSGPPPLAVVDGEPIPVAALDRELAVVTMGADGGAAADATLRRRLLDDLIARALLLQDARRRAVAAAPEEVERALSALRADYTGAQFEALLAEQRLSEPELRARLADQLTIEKLLRERVFAGLSVGDEEVARYYAEHGAEFDQPAQVHARQVVVRTREEAQRVLAELRRRPDAFADVARRVSIAPEAAAGGDLGWFGRGSGMPEVFDACLTLPVKVLSEVVASPYGFHLFEVTGRRPAQRRPLGEVRELIRDRLLREARGRTQQAYLAALREKATITIDEPALTGR